MKLKDMQITAYAKNGIIIEIPRQILEDYITISFKDKQLINTSMLLIKERRYNED